MGSHTNETDSSHCWLLMQGVCGIVVNAGQEMEAQSANPSVEGPPGCGASPLACILVPLFYHFIVYHADFFHFLTLQPGFFETARPLHDTYHNQRRLVDLLNYTS